MISCCLLLLMGTRREGLSLSEMWAPGGASITLEKSGEENTHAHAK